MSFEKVNAVLSIFNLDNRVLLKSPCERILEIAVYFMLNALAIHGIDILILLVLH
ncbi:MAG: hypothetical protein ACJATI_005068 [Halioglobus sp.]|jgi:hypothetical protein